MMTGSDDKSRPRWNNTWRNRWLVTREWKQPSSDWVHLDKQTPRRDSGSRQWRQYTMAQTWQKTVQPC